MTVACVDVTQHGVFRNGRRRHRRHCICIGLQNRQELLQWKAAAVSRRQPGHPVAKKRWVKMGWTWFEHVRLNLVESNRNAGFSKKIVKTQAVGKSMLVVLSTKTQMLLNCYDLNAKLLQFPLVESPVLWLLKFPYIILFVKISLVPVTKKTLRKNNLFCMASILISIIIFISKEGKSSQSGKSPCFLPNFPTSPPVISRSTRQRCGRCAQDCLRQQLGKGTFGTPARWLGDANYG